MSDYDDRGAYTPPADRLAFDPRQPVRGGGPAPVTLIVSGLVLASLVGGVFFLYRDGFRHRGEAPALVGAPVADARTAAPPAADVNAAPASLVVDKTTAPVPAPAFAPAPPQPLPPQAASAPPRVTPVVARIAAPASAPASLKAAPPPQVVMLDPTAPPKPAATSPKKFVAASEPAPGMAAEAAPPRKVAAIAPTRLAAAAPKQPVHHSATMTIASLTDDALAHRTRAARDEAARDFQPAEAARPAAIPAHHIAAHIKGAQFAAARTAASADVARVQIGAFSTPALADQGWRDIARLEPGAMAGKGKDVQSLERDDGSTLYRTYVTGFASASAAQAFCDDLRAAGKACMVR